MKRRFTCEPSSALCGDAVQSLASRLGLHWRPHTRRATVRGCEHFFRLANGSVADCQLPRGHRAQVHESRSDAGYVITWTDAAPFDAIGDGRLFVPGEIDLDDVVTSHPAAPPPPELRLPPPELRDGL